MTVKIKNIGGQVRSLEDEIKAVKVLLKSAPKGKEKTKGFASLKGIWKGKVHFTMDEIKNAEIQVKEL